MAASRYPQSGKLRGLYAQPFAHRDHRTPVRLRGRANFPALAAKTNRRIPIAGPAIASASGRIRM
ncbi:MAG: hypothetical protein Kow0010_24510 [Dehalococcoidia bacterium]